VNYFLAHSVEVYVNVDEAPIINLSVFGLLSVECLLIINVAPNKSHLMFSLDLKLEVRSTKFRILVAKDTNYLSAFKFKIFVLVQKLAQI